MEEKDGGIAMTCSLQEAASMLGLSYDYVLGQSKVENPDSRIPGFSVGKTGYRVVVSELPAWLRRKAGLA